MRQLSYKQIPKVSSLPSPVAGLEGVIVELSGDKKAYYCDGVAWTDLTAGGAGSGTVIHSGVTTIDFGAFPGVTDAVVEVTGQTGILTSSLLRAWISGSGSTTDHDAEDHRMLNHLVTVSAGSPDDALSKFSIYVTAEEGIEGTYEVCWSWYNP